MEKQKNIPTKDQNPNGLHQRYSIRKIVPVVMPAKQGDGMYGKRIEPLPERIVYKEVAVSKNAEYFVLRLDTGGSDINHIKACRIGIHAYADAIETTIPELAKDLRERYPLL